MARITKHGVPYTGIRWHDKERSLRGRRRPGPEETIVGKENEMTEPAQLDRKGTGMKQGAKEGGKGDTLKVIVQALLIALVVRTFCFSPSIFRPAR